MRGKIISHIVHHGTSKNTSGILFQFGKTKQKKELPGLEQMIIWGSVPNLPCGVLVKTGPPFDHSRVILKHLDIS